MYNLNVPLSEGSTVLCWHFAQANMLTRQTSEPIVVGGTLHHNGPVKVHYSGLHGSIRLLDLLLLAPPSPCICRVELGGLVVQDGMGMLAGTCRTCLWAIPYDRTERVLLEFACRCSVKALTLAKVTDARSWNSVASVRKQLRGDLAAGYLPLAHKAAVDATRGRYPEHTFWARKAAENCTSKEPPLIRAQQAEYCLYMSSIHSRGKYQWASNMVLEGLAEEEHEHG